MEVNSARVVSYSFEILYDSPCMEAGSNTCESSEVMKMEPSAGGYNWATLFLGHKYGDLTLQVGGVSNLRQ
jgi:hypothetical protein